MEDKTKGGGSKEKGEGAMRWDRKVGPSKERREQKKGKGGCGSGVEPASCDREVAGSIPLVCVSRCPWAKYCC